LTDWIVAASIARCLRTEGRQAGLFKCLAPCCILTKFDFSKDFTRLVSRKLQAFEGTDQIERRHPLRVPNVTHLVMRVRTQRGLSAPGG
jgi:hypothetical protein